MAWTMIFKDRMTNVMAFLLFLLFHGSTAVNLALHRPVWESQKNSKRVPESAVDGSRGTNIFVGGSCTHSTNHKDPWWIVDLECSYSVDNVIIVNRGDCCGSRLHNFTVEVASAMAFSNDFTHFKQCYHYPTAAPGGATLDLQCDQPVAGRYVKVQIFDTGVSVLSLCEVEVYGSALTCENTGLFNGMKDTEGLGTILKSVVTQLKNECALYCSLVQGCSSFNIKSNGDDTYNCELTSCVSGTQPQAGSTYFSTCKK